MRPPRSPLERAVAGLGFAALAAAATTVARGELDVFRIRGWGLVVTLLLGLLAVLAGWLGRRWVATVVGAGFLAAAVVQIVQLGGEAGAVRHGVLGGNAATFGLWLAFGVGFVVLGLAPTRERRRG